MRLADFILANIEPILAEWEVFARDIWPGSMTDPATLRDDAADVLRATAADMKSGQTATQQADKSKGKSQGGDGSLHSARMNRASVAHGRDRHGWGFDLPEVISEYRALRASVVRLWSESHSSPDAHDLADLTRFSESIDQSLTEAVVAFTKIVERERQAVADEQSHMAGQLREVNDALLVSNVRQQELAEQASLLAAIVASSKDAIISKNPDGVITSWNRGAQHLFGYTAEEAVAKPVTMLIPDDHLDEEPQILQRIRSGASVEHYETVRRRKDGSLVDISLTVSPIRNAAGQVIGASTMARDITAEKQAEAALRNSEERFRQLADSMPQIVWTARPDGHIDYYNERWYEYTGFPRDNFGQSSWEPILHPDDVQRCVETYFGCIQTEKPYQIEYRFKDRESGGHRWFMGRALPIRDEAGRILRWFGTCTDIDSVKRAEETLRDSQEALARSNAEIKQFTYVASHDLQEPLRMVNAFARLLAERHAGQLDAEAHEFLGHISEGAERMRQLISDLLSYGRVDLGESSPRGLVDLEHVFNRVLSTQRAGLEHDGSKITHDPLPCLTANAIQMEQLFQNLLANALKFGRVGTPSCIHVSAVRQGGDWLLAVKDNGIGIEPRFFDRIFAMFQRLHTKEAYGGTGIGLSICKKIVEKHGGRIWVESEPGVGATFFFTLPAEP